MAAFAKPENALKRAKELIAVNQKTQALQVMHEVLSSKKHRQWQDTLEKIMKKYIKLSVEMRQQKRAKDGLHQYRMICSQTHLPSLEKVIRYFLKVADKYARDAQSKADKIAVDLSKIEDLDAEDAADVVSTSQDDTKDRTDREIVTPWLKFLWETYRTVLEILRNNQTLEALYQETAQQAYNFCLKYKRTTEFRRLAEILRNHLFQTKSPNQQQPVTLSSPESLNLHLETRFVQLNVAMDLELWQEAFRSIEDIHGLMTLAKKAPKPQLMANYYQKLTQIFWVSNNHLFHAYAWYKYYALTKAHKPNLTPEEIRMMTSSVLLAALSIPMPSKRANEHYLDVDVQKEKNTRLAALLGFSINPKRDVLLAELASKNISALVLPELKDLYNLLEKKFHPLELCAAVKPKLDFIAAHPQLSQYHKPLEKLLFTRLLQQLSKVYQVMKLSELQRLASFADAQSVERWTIEAVKNGHIEARLDHQTRALSFGSQVLESEKMRTQLTELSKNLQMAVEMLHPEAAKAREDRKRAVFAQLIHGAEEEHKRILARKANIEKRKELQEMLEKIKAKEEADLAASRQPVAAPTETKPAAEAPKPVVDTAAKEAAEARQEALDKLKKARQALDKKMAKLARRLDYLERARRDAEKPILQAAIEKQRVEDAAFLEEQMKTTLERAKKQHQTELEEKKRLSRMVSFKADYEARIMKRRQEEFTKAKAAQDARMADVRASIEKLREKRKAADERRRAEEERARKQREEDDRARRETEEKRRAEEAARAKKLDEMSDVQRRREQETLDKQRGPGAPAAGRPGVPPARDGAYRPPMDRGDRPPMRGPVDEEASSAGPAGWRRIGGNDRPMGGDRPAMLDRPPVERSDRGDRDGAYRPPMDRGDRPPMDRGDRPPMDRGDRPPMDRGDRPPMDRGDRPPMDRGGAYRPPMERGDRPPMDRDREGGSYRPPMDRGDRDGGSYRPPMDRGDRPPMDRDREGGYRPPMDRGDRPPMRDGDREGGSYRPPMDRGDRPPMDRGDRWGSGPRGDSGGAYRPPGERGDSGGSYRPPMDRGDRPPMDRGDRPPMDRGDRPPMDRGDRPPMDRGDRPMGGGGGAYRPPGERGDSGGSYRPPMDRGDRPPMDRDYQRRDDGPRGGPPPSRGPEPRRDAPAPAASKEEEDGFTTVKRGARPAKK